MKTVRIAAAAVAASLSLSLVACGNAEYDAQAEAWRTVMQNTTAEEWVAICADQERSIDAYAEALAAGMPDASLSDDDWRSIVMEPVVKGCVVNGQ